MSAVLGALLVGACAFACVLLLLERRGAGAAVRLAPYVEPGSRRAKRPPARAAVAFARSVPGRASTRALERAGSRATPVQLAAVDIAAAVVGGALALAAGFAAPAALVAALAGAVTPYLVLRLRATRRARAFDAQLPDLLDLLASSLRVGHGLEQSLRSAADGAAAPLSEELQRALGEIRLGARSADALAGLGRRVASEDMAYVSVAIEIQQEVGGSLAELLGVVAEAVRERKQFRRKVRAVTGMQRMSATMLVVLPLLAGAALSAISPAYMHPLWHTSTGRVLVVVALAMMATGTLILKRIVAVGS